MKPNDSITVTPGAGATVATHLLDGREIQVVALIDASGHLMGSHDQYTAVLTTMSQSANKNYISLFNASTQVVEIIQAKAAVEATATVSGLSRGYRLYRLNAVHSGGTVVTPTSINGEGPLSTDITVRGNGQTAAPGALIYFDSIKEDEAAGDSFAMLWDELAMRQPVVCNTSEGVLIRGDATAGLPQLSAGFIFRVR